MIYTDFDVYMVSPMKTKMIYTDFNVYMVSPMTVKFELNQNTNKERGGLLLKSTNPPYSLTT